jgi:hypothetical protein
VKAFPGDLILWDSRMIHGATSGPGLTQEEDALFEGLARMSFTVCMT